MPLQDTPIRRKLMTMVLLTSGAVLLLTCTAFIAYELLSFRQTMVGNVTILGDVIAANSTASLAFENREDATEVLAALKAEGHIVAASLYDTNGQLFAKYPASLAADAFPAAPERDGYHFEPSSLVGVQPVVQGNNKRLGTLYLKSDLGALHERLRLYSGVAALVLAVSFLLAYMLSRALQRQISHPILALAETAKAISDRQDYSVRATKHSEDELGLLTDAFNQMLTQIHGQDQALRASEERLRLLLSATHRAAWDWDIAANRLWHQEDLGAGTEGVLSNEEGVGARWLERVHPEDRERIAGSLQALVEGQDKICSQEYRYRNADGSYAEVLERGVVIRNAGKPVRMLGAMLDITELKQAEARLRESEQRFARFMEHLPGLAWIKDLQGRYAYANEAAERAFRTPRTELYGKTDDEVFPCEISAQFKENDRRALASETGIQTIETLKHEDGVVRHSVVSKFPISGPDGNVAMIGGVAIDITDLKRAEEEIRRLNEELEERVRLRTAELTVANQNLEAFSYSVSHDLRAPLRHIHGFSDLLRRQHEAKLDDQGRRYLGKILGSAQQMGVLIDELLAFSRIGRAELKRTQVDLRELVEEVRDLLQPEMGGCDIAWAIGELPQVPADRPLLRSVLQNLISNALKYSAPRQRAEITISATRESGEFVVSIRDNGVGFDMKYADRLFGVFQRLHSDFEGTGIGLATVRRIILRHGGRVWAEGAVDEGACFYFTLPDELPVLSE